MLAALLEFIAGLLYGGGEIAAEPRRGRRIAAGLMLAALLLAGGLAVLAVSHLLGGVVRRTSVSPDDVFVSALEGQVCRRPVSRGSTTGLDLGVRVQLTWAAMSLAPATGLVRSTLN